MPPKRLVLDTNIWLDWLMFKDACVLHLRHAVSEGRAEICIDALAPTASSPRTTRYWNSRGAPGPFAS